MHTPTSTPTTGTHTAAPSVSTPPDRGGGALEVARAAGTVVDLLRTGSAVARRPWTHRLRGAWFTMWVAGISLDAATTVLMMGSGQYEEANGVAASGMGALGVGGYIVLVSLVCLVLATLASGRPRNVYGAVIVTVLVVVGAMKLYTGLSNLALAAGWTWMWIW